MKSTNRREMLSVVCYVRKMECGVMSASRGEMGMIRAMRMR